MDLIQEEVKCSICVDDFDIPVTIHCGHTFCRECLRKSVSKECPLCRKPIISLVQHMQENRTIAEVVKFVRDHRNSNEKEGRKDLDQPVLQPETSPERLIKIQMNSVRMFDTSSKILLLPFGRARITILSNAVNLPLAMNNVVIQQKDAKRSLSVLGNLSQVTLNVNSLFQFQCLFEGLNFFQVSKVEYVEEAVEGTQLCSGFALKENTRLHMDSFNQFFNIYDRVGQEYRVSMGQVVSTDILMNRTNPLGVLYSVFILMSILDNQKYQILTSFDDQTRLDSINKFFANIAVSAAIRNPSVVFRFPVPGNSSSMYVFALVFVLFLFWKLNNK